MRPSPRTFALAALLLPAFQASAFDTTITSGASSGGAWSGNVWTPTADGATLAASEIATHLASGAVTVVSTDGDALTVSAAMNWSANTLTLSASGDLDIEATLGASGSAGLVLEYGQNAVAVGNTARYRVAAPVNLATTASVATRQGSDGAAANYTIITSLGSENSVTGLDLQGMQGNLAANYALGADIDASAASAWSGGFVPVGNATTKFTGRFDGLGHTISNLSIQRGGQDNIGLFGYSNGAYFANLGLDNVNILGTANVGALLGRGDGNNSIDNVWSSGTVSSDSGVTTKYGAGGLVGRMTGTVANSHSSATVSGYLAVGGLVGAMDASGSVNNFAEQVFNSWASGDVSATYGYGGGLVGRNYGRIIDSHATGNVSGGQMLGGLVGYSSISPYWAAHRADNTDSRDQYRTIYATGNVTGTGNNVGGLAGQMEGIFWMRNAFATGNVSGNNNVGGLIGGLQNTGNTAGVSAANFLNVYSQGGTVTGNDSVGGLIGRSATHMFLSNSYSASGTVTGNSNVGGLFGYFGGDGTDVSSAVWNRETTGTDIDTGNLTTGVFYTTSPAGQQYVKGFNNTILGATTEQMKTLDPYSFASFNANVIATPSTAAAHPFSELDSVEYVWLLYEGQSLPLLRAFLTPLTVAANSGSKPFDGTPDSPFGVTYTPADPDSRLLGTAVTTATGSTPGTHPIKVSGLYSVSQFGYEIAFVDGLLTITCADCIFADGFDGD